LTTLKRQSGRQNFAEKESSIERPTTFEGASVTRTWQFHMASLLGYVAVLVLILVVCAEEVRLSVGLALPL
jgi:hypothetical protein